MNPRRRSSRSSRGPSHSSWLQKTMVDTQTRARILVVDDEPNNVRSLEKVLRRSGYEAVRGTSDPRKAQGVFLEFRPDLVLLDMHMPHLDGFKVMDQLRPLIPDAVYLPILVLTGDHDPVIRQRALAAGAKDFLSKPFELTEVLLRIHNLLETRFLHLALKNHNETLEQKVRERTRELADAKAEILHRLAIAAEYRDDITGRHAERVGALSSRIGQAMGLSAEVSSLLRRAAPLHDVGKIGIPDAILMKPGPLTPQEFGVMKSHTVIGARILSGSDFPLLKQARTIALTHHEHWDGRGYPRGLAGVDIPLSGRILAVADVFDCLIHERPYKQAFTHDDALATILEERGAHFDPAVVDGFLEVLAATGISDWQDEPAEVPDPEMEAPEVVAARIRS